MPRTITPPIFGALALFAGLSVLMLGGVTLPFDEAVLRWAGEVRSPALLDAMLLASFVADGTTIAILGLGICALLWRLSGRRAALALLLGSLSGELGYVVLKAAFQRPRPRVIEHLSTGGWHSYPSGHTMMSVIILSLGLVLLAGALPRVRGLLVTLAVVIPLTVAAARVTLGVHYPSDVLGGLAVGLAWLLWWRDWASRSSASRTPSTA